MVEPMALGLNHDEALYLGAYLRRLTQWDERTAVRLQVRGANLGVYASPPLGVLSLIVVPAAEASGMEPDFDRVVSAGRLRDILGDLSSHQGMRHIAFPDAVMGPPSLGMLPPREGWFPPVKAIAGDLVSTIDASIEHLNARTAGTIEPFQRQIAEEEWSRLGWGTLPNRVLHAARQLGFLGHAGARIQASSNGPWKRLISPGGQVFVHTQSSLPPLKIVR
jgi:hypothetical protein